MTGLTPFLKSALIAGGLASHALVQPTVAQDVSASDPNSVVEAMQVSGRTVDLTRDVFGDPSIDSSVDGEAYTVFFHGCEDGKNCTDLEIWVVLLPDTSPPQAVIDRWNRENPNWKAYLDDEGDPVLERYLLQGNKMPRSRFRSLLSEWDQKVIAYMALVGR